MKLYLGSRSKQYDGFLAIYKLGIFKPNIVRDLEIIPCPIKNHSVMEIKMHYILEYLG